MGRATTTDIRNPMINDAERTKLVKELEAAVLAEACRLLGAQRELRATFNEETGRVDLHQIVTVTAIVQDSSREIGLGEAQRIDQAAQIGSQLRIELRYGPGHSDELAASVLALPPAWRSFHRSAAAVVKMTILNTVRARTKGSDPT
jgi:transcription termination/antitermination protein NusA